MSNIHKNKFDIRTQLICKQITSQWICEMDLPAINQDRAISLRSYTMAGLEEKYT